MSLGGRADAAALRRVIAEIEAHTGRKERRERASRRLTLAHDLDAVLGGGLADDALHEIAPAEPADGAAAMAFALALMARFLDGRPASALIVGESFAAHETGALYGPGLVAHGLPLKRLVFVETPDANTTFWAMEEALKCGAPAAVVGEIWSLKGYGLAASRRLLLAARKGGTPALLVLAGAYGQAERISSAADTRFEIAAAPSVRMPAAGCKDMPGPFACGARLVKARLSGGAVDSPSADGRPYRRPMDRATAFVDAVDDRVRDQRSRLQERGYKARLHDPTRRVRLEWRNEERTFDDPAISLALAAASGDGPRAAPQQR